MKIHRIAATSALFLLPLAGCVSAPNSSPVCDPSKTIATLDTQVTYEDEAGFRWDRDVNGVASIEIMRQFPNTLIDDFDQDGRIDDCEWYISKSMRGVI